MKVNLKFETPEGAFDFSHPFEDVEGFIPAVEAFIHGSIPSPFRIDCAIAFGFAWGAFMNGVVNADNPLSLSAQAVDCRCTTQISDTALEAVFGVSRQ